MGCQYNNKLAICLQKKKIKWKKKKVFVTYFNFKSPDAENKSFGDSLSAMYQGHEYHNLRMFLCRNKKISILLYLKKCLVWNYAFWSVFA